MKKARGSAKISTAIGLMTMLFGAMMVIAPGASAAPAAAHKVTICHRTNAVTNPYVTPTVDFSGADGAIVHGPNHYEHQDAVGGVFDFGAPDAPGYETTYPTPRNGEQWEDIIPPVPYGEGEWVGGAWTGAFTTGLNWDDDGKAVYFGTAGPWPALDQGFYGQPFDAVCGAPGAAQEPPVVIVEKDVPDADVDGRFNFSITGHDDFDLGDGEQEDFAVTAGSITVAEDLTDLVGFTLTGVVCTSTSAQFPDGTVLDTTLDDGEVTFDIADGEVVECVFTNVPVVAPTHSATLAKTNDANGTGGYTDDETAPTAGADVPFEVVITNTGTGDLTVDGLTDHWPGLGEPLDLLGLGEGELVCTTPDGDDEGDAPDEFSMAVGAVIPAGAVVTCRFTIDGYSPAAGGAITNTVTLDTEETADVQDTSIVRTPGGGTCTEDCAPPPPPPPPPGQPTPEPSSLTVVKAVDAEDPAAIPDDWTFPFTVTVLGGFDLTAGSPSLSEDVAPGSYTITETDAGGAELTDIACTGGVVTDFDDDSITVTVAEGDAVTCTFTNTFEAEVQGQVVTPPAPTPPAVQGVQVTRQLPRTGSGSDTLAATGLGLLAFGAMLTMTGRRRLRSAA